MSDNILVCTQDSAGRWQPVGTIFGATSDVGGGFLYDEHYFGPPLAPQLDYTKRAADAAGSERFFPLPSERFGGPQSRSDLHAVFESALPGKAGRQVIAMRSPAFLKQSPFEQLATLASLGDWRSGGMMFVRNGALDFRATRGLEALTALNDEINKRVVEIRSRGVIPRGMTIGSEQDQWALATNRSEAFTIEVCHRGAFYVANAAREVMGSQEEGRIEAGLLRAAEAAGNRTVDFLLHQDPKGTGEAILLARRFDAEALPRPEGDEFRIDNGGIDLDDEANVPSRRMHKLSMHVALDVVERAKLDYADVAEFLRDQGTDAEGDVRDLYGRMMMNAFAEVTNDHLGQFEVVQDGTGWRLAPTHGLMIDDPDTQRPHALKMAGTERPEFSVEWVDRCSKAFDIPRDEGREIASRVLREVARLPDYWRGYGMSEDMIGRLSQNTQTPLHRSLKEQLDGTGLDERHGAGISRRGPRLG